MIRDSYAKVLVADALWRRYLALGRSPTESQVRALNSQMDALGAGLAGSRVQYEPEADTEGSAQGINKAILTFSQEIRAILLGSFNMDDTTQTLFDRSESRLALLNQQAAELMLTGCALQVARRNGFSLVSLDSLSGLNKVNLQRTSAEIDLASNSAKLKKQKTSRRWDLTHLEDSAFDVFMADGSNAGLSQAPGSRFMNAVDDSDSFWLQRVTSEDDQPKTLTFQMDMGKMLVLSRITFEPLGQDEEGSYITRVLASANGVNWREISEKRRTTTRTEEVSVLAIQARYIRMELTREKPSYQLTDSRGTFVFEFGLNNLRVFETGYFPKGDFVTKPIQFRNTLGVAQQINRVLIEVFEEKPVGTDITYYIAKDPEDLGSVTRIVPGQELVLSSVESISTDGQVRSRFNSGHALVNISVPSDVLPESITFFRNTYQEGVQIDGIAAGWRYENSYFNCVFEVEEDFEVNFGINFAFVDGKKVNGIQTIAAGIHTFRTHETNWAEATTEEQDPLFPHNHKLLIEGLRGSTTYTGADFVAADQLQLVSAFDLLNNVDIDDGNRFFGIYKGYPLVKIPKPPVDLGEVEGWRREQYSIRYKFPGNGEEPTTSIALIARLTSVSPRYTPVFKGYTAAAGY